MNISFPSLVNPNSNYLQCLKNCAIHVIDTWWKNSLSTGLVLIPVEYDDNFNKAFVMGPHPGDLVFLSDNTGIESRTMETKHKIHFKIYEKCTGVEKALIQ